jgi:hypothetical protein
LRDGSCAARQLEIAAQLYDLRVPLGNRLEALTAILVWRMPVWQVQHRSFSTKSRGFITLTPPQPDLTNKCLSPLTMTLHGAEIAHRKNLSSSGSELAPGGWTGNFGF